MSYDQLRPQRFSILPPVVKNILIINGLLFFATLVFGDKLGFDLTTILGLFYPTSESFRIYQYVTYIFMHGSIDHIFFNLFAVWMFGSVLENYWGGKRFLIFYMITGIGAGLVQTAYTALKLAPLYSFMDAPTVGALIDIQNSFNNIRPDYLQGIIDTWSLSPKDADLVEIARERVFRVLEYQLKIPTVGASGSLFGILLAFGMLFPNTMIYLFFFLPMRAKYFVIIYGVIELVAGVSNREGDNIAHFAHLGGMLFGFILIKIWQRNRSRFY